MNKKERHEIKLIIIIKVIIETLSIIRNEWNKYNEMYRCFNAGKTFKYIYKWNWITGLVIKKEEE